MVFQGSLVYQASLGETHNHTFPIVTSSTDVVWYFDLRFCSIQVQILDIDLK